MLLLATGKKLTKTLLKYVVSTWVSDKRFFTEEFKQDMLRPFC